MLRRADATIRGNIDHLEQVRAWFGRPLWEMEPPDADAYFGRVLRSAAGGTRPARARLPPDSGRLRNARSGLEIVTILHAFA